MKKSKKEPITSGLRAAGSMSVSTADAMDRLVDKVLAYKPERAPKKPQVRRKKTS
jgi:hypothetical protein